MTKLSFFVRVLFFCAFLYDSQPLPGTAKRGIHAVINQPQNNPRTKDAFVTLLYGGYVLPVRVLGQSIRDTGTKNDLIALCTEAVTEKDKTILRSDGWIIRSVKNIDSPFIESSPRGLFFKGIFTKLGIWNMTDYERIIYLDGDVLVLANIDHMFDCGTFCAAYRHSDLLNAGVLVVEPSKEIFKDILDKIPKTTSYDDGDQGFLNVYFKEVAYAPMFNWSDPTRQRRPMRMSGRLNADMGMYYAFSTFDVPANEVRVIHFTLGSIKPWQWWTLYSGLLELGWLWQEKRKRLNEHAEYMDHYRWWNPIFWAPFPLVIIMFVILKLLCRPFLLDCQKNCITKLLSYCASFSEVIRMVLPLTILFLSYYLSFKIVPEAMEPNQAEYVFWAWSNFFLVSLSCVILQFYISRNTSDGDFSSRVSPANKRRLLACFLLYQFGYILLKVIPPLVHPFSRRVVIFFVLLAVHLTSAHIAGKGILEILISTLKGTG